MRKRILIILIVCILFSACGCSAGAYDTVKPPPKEDDSSAISGPADTASSLSSETAIYYEPDSLPDGLDFGGELFTVLTVGDDRFKYEILTDELNSEPVNDSVFNREKYVEDRLNLDISQVKIVYQEYNEEVAKQHASGDNEYQLFAASTVWFSQSVFDGYLQDLYDIDYIDFSKPWWSRLFNSEAEIGGHLFLTTGSLSISTMRFIYAVYYNKKLASDYSQSFPELGDIYGMVDSGRWTYDKLKSLTGSIYVDMNGNSEKDGEDLYGLAVVDGNGIDAVWSSFDMSILGKDEDGWLTPDVNKDKIFKTVEMMQDLYHHTEGSYVLDSFEEAEKMFAGGMSVFSEGKLMSAETSELRNMQEEYGLIPYPKYDENQTEYYSGAHDQYVSFSIPQTNPAPDTAGAVLEAMGSYAYRDTVPKYLDVTLKGRYMSDAHSRRMVDLIVKGFRMDSGWIYSRLTGFFPQEFFRLEVSTNSKSYASSYAKAFQLMKIAIGDLKNRNLNF